MNLFAAMAEENRQLRDQLGQGAVGLHTLLGGTDGGAANSSSLNAAGASTSVQAALKSTRVGASSSGGSTARRGGNGDGPYFPDQSGVR